METTWEPATSGENSPTQLLALQRLADFPARVEILEQRAELNRKKFDNKVEMDAFRKSMAQKRFDLAEKTFAVRQQQHQDRLAIALKDSQTESASLPPFPSVQKSEIRTPNSPMVEPYLQRSEPKSQVPNPTRSLWYLPVCAFATGSAAREPALRRLPKTLSAPDRLRLLISRVTMTLKLSGVYAGNDIIDRPDSALDRRYPKLASQPKLGLHSEWRHRPASDHSDYSALDGQDLRSSVVGRHCLRNRASDFHWFTGTACGKNLLS